MERKISVRMDAELYNGVKAEQEKFGYRSLSAYICKILSERIVLEISGGSEMARAIHLLEQLSRGDARLAERRELLCQSYGLLMTGIEELNSSIRSYVTSGGEEA